MSEAQHVTGMVAGLVTTMERAEFDLYRLRQGLREQLNEARRRGSSNREGSDSKDDIDVLALELEVLAELKTRLGAFAKWTANASRSLEKKIVDIRFHAAVRNDE